MRDILVVHVEDKISEYEIENIRDIIAAQLELGDIVVVDGAVREIKTCSISSEVDKGAVISFDSAK